MYLIIEGAEVKLLEGGIIYVKWLEGGASVKNAKYILKQIKKQLGNGPFLMLPDTRVFKSMPKPIRDYFNSEEVAELVIASAILVDNGLSKMIANLALNFMTPKYPIKIFSDKQKAIDWLLEYERK